MARYYVVLDGVGETGPYVIAEVVREPSDTGRNRDTSLAGNLAGSDARILTDDELREIDGGRRALDRWRSGDDTLFILDTLAHDIGIAEMPIFDRSRALSVDGARLLVQTNTHRAHETWKKAEATRRKSERSRKELQRTLDQVRARSA